MPEIIDRVTCNNNEWFIEDERSKYISEEPFLMKEVRFNNPINFFNKIIEHGEYFRQYNHQKGPLIKLSHYLSEKKYEADDCEFLGISSLPFVMQNIYKKDEFNKSNEYFYNSVLSLNYLEFSDNKSHTHTMGGDAIMRVEEIVDRFYKDANIQSIYVQREDTDIQLFLVLFDDEIDQLALGLAKLQNEVSRDYPEYNIEINYLSAKYFSSDYLSDDAVPYLRR